MRILILVAVLALSGCANTQTFTVPKEVKVPVPVACIDEADVPKVPAVATEAELMGMDEYRRTLATWLAYLKLEIYKREAAAVIDRCSRIPAGGVGLKSIR